MILGSATATANGVSLDGTGGDVPTSPAKLAAQNTVYPIVLSEGS